MVVKRQQAGTGEKTGGVAQHEALLKTALEHHRSGGFETAEPVYLKLLEISPSHVDALHYLGLLRHQTGRNDDAITLLEQALVTAPENPTIHYNLAVVLQAEMRIADARHHYDAVIRLSPGYAMAYNNLGTLAKLEGQDDDAMRCYEEALQYDPRCAEALNNLGSLYRKGGKHEQALGYFESAVSADPNLSEAYINLAFAYGRINRIDQCVSAYRRALALRGFPKEHSDLLMNLHYLSESSPQEIFHEHKAWAERYAQGLFDGVAGYANGRDPRKRLRIGYVSQDFYNHSVAFFFEPLLENRSSNFSEIYCYASVKEPDHVTERLRRMADVWRDASAWSDEELTQQIRNDDIDILVDLAGHSAGNRMLVFARKPAPIQVTYLGYPNTTGLGAMDYRITDAMADPVGLTDSLHSETLIRLAHGFLAYRPHEAAPPVAALPALANGCITFGSFNNCAKLSRATIACWAKILRRVPNSRLLLKYRTLGEATVREELLEKFAAHGIEADRLKLLDRTPVQVEHLALYEKVDIALDPFPYNGTTTTCEALWMGVPVIVLAGASHVARVGASIMTHANLPQLIAGSDDEYVNLAVGLAGDIHGLAQVRTALREQVARSDLTNGALLARSIEQAFRAVWAHYCATSEPHS